MTVIAALMPDGVYSRQMLPEHLRRLQSICANGDYFHVPDLEGLLGDPRLADVQVLLTGWGAPKLDASFLKRCPSLQLISHCAGSIRHLVEPSFFDQGLRITNSSDANAIPVSEFLISWILRWNKALPTWERRYRSGSYDSFRARNECMTIGNRGKTIGIIGASKVGRKLMALLRHFELDVVLFDPFVSSPDAADFGAVKVELDELLAASDIVSINAPLLPETKNMIGSQQLAQMRDGALLINTSRGPLVDHQALLAELKTGRISAVLDVTDPEPLPEGSPFFELENVFLTPHVAGSLGLEIHRMTDSAIDEVALFLAEDRLQHEVTLEDWGRAA